MKRIVVIAGFVLAIAFSAASVADGAVGDEQSTVAKGNILDYH